MAAWKPFFDFLAPYVIAGVSALCLLWASGKPYTLRQLIGKTGRGSLLGGALAPLLGALPNPAWIDDKVKLDVAEKTRAWAMLLGGGYIGAKDIRSAILRMLGKNSDDSANGPPQP